MEPDPSKPTSQPEPAPAGLRPLVRRLIALGLLGSAIALVVLQITRSMRHEVSMDLGLEPGLAGSLSRLELTVIDPQLPQEPASLTIFRFDKNHPAEPKLKHIFQLPNGRYELTIRLYQGNNPQALEARRTFEVSGDSALGFRLP
jgi:hypothetical protein